MTGAISGNDPTSPRATELRGKIIGAREMPTGKANWLVELRTIVDKILGMGPAAPAALRRLVPVLEAAHQTMEAARPQQGSRREKDVYEWAPAVRRRTLAISEAAGAFLSWSNGVEIPPRRRASIGRIAQARRPGEREEAKAATGEGNGSAPGSGNGSGTKG